MTGTLFIVATPIGNLKDITFRAIETLKNVDYILCEDTRVTGRLTSSYGIDKKFSILNDFNEESTFPKIVEDLISGLNIAIVSDGGTPLISDPGFKLVRAALAEGIRVDSIPGPTALIHALVVSGLPADKFLFLGFLPKKNGKRLELLKSTKAAVSMVKSTVIIFESPFRISKTLEQIDEVFGDIHIVVTRELTKMHEEVVRGKISDVKDKITNKGEFIILLNNTNS